MELDFIGKTDLEATTQLTGLIPNLHESGPITFTIDRSPDTVLKAVWESNPGKFDCYLIEEVGEQKKLRLEAKKVCCGSCH